jgi:hypothetical protein
MCCRYRYTDRNLTIGLLARLPVVLMRHTHRMLALLGNARIVDNPVTLILVAHSRLDPLPTTIQ